jgi:hypothetical protein
LKQPSAALAPSIGGGSSAFALDKNAVEERKWLENNVYCLSRMLYKSALFIQ